MDIAITGIGLRFPPNCSTPEEFWNFILKKGDAISDVPADRWDWRRFFDQDRNRPGKTYVKRAGFLKQDLTAFDPMAFGISPREAVGLDPQQRLLLEAAWEAFEDAGVPLESLEGSPTGVFIGGFCLDHLLHQNHPANRFLAGPQSATAATMTILANRISYTFNLAGPSLTMDTACSSSLVALHAACQSITSGESKLALAGGVNAMMRPEFPILMSKGQFLSDHGNCRAFDQSANGYVRGEGVGVVLLKPVTAAIKDGDSIYAVIRATGANQDGRTSGISLPNREAQEALIRAVYEKAQLDPAEVSYVEAHGTGTQAGDPAEAAALNAVFSSNRPENRKLLVGSVKTNIGHLEAGAGVAGLIKAVLLLHHRKIPPHLHLENPNPKIPFSNYCLRIPTEEESLPQEKEAPLLFASVNSFGYGGTNAHAVIASAPLPPERESGSNADDQEVACEALFPISARSPEALREAGSRLAFFLKRSKEIQRTDLLYSLAHRRSHLSHRAIIRATDLDDLRRKCILLSTGEAADGVVLGSEAVSKEIRPAFVCTGMGPQWWGMGRSLFKEDPIFRETLEEIEEIFHPMAGWSLKEALLADEKTSRMHRTEVAQPSNLAIQVALARLWRKWGIQPDSIVGHSVGEVSAAYLAGVYSMEEAVLISYHRSRLQQTTAGKGKMLAVGLSEADALERLGPCPGVSVAAINSYASVTLSGDSGELESIAETLNQEGVFNKFLTVEVAYHSPQMDPLREELLEALSPLKPKEPKLPLFSTVRGEISQPDDWDSQYWWRNVRQPVRFAAAIQQMIESGSRHFLEIGPHPVLKNSIQEVASNAGETIACLPSLRRKEPELPLLKHSLAELHTLGASLNWEALIPAGGNFVRLPRYPWQRKSHWLESDASKMDRLGLPGPVYQNQQIEATRPTWEVEINRNFFPFLADHGVQDQTVFPGMGYVEAALFLNHALGGSEPVCLRDVDFEKVLIVDPNLGQHLVSSLDPEAGIFELCSRQEGTTNALQRHARGRISAQREGIASDETIPDPVSWRQTCPKQVRPEVVYEKLERRGLHYGPWFRSLREIHIGQGAFYAVIEKHPDLDPDQHLIHPTLLDGALQPILYIARGNRLFVPDSIGELRFLRKPSESCVILGQLTHQTENQLEANVWIIGEDGLPSVVIERVTCQAIETGTTRETRVYLPRWIPDPLKEDAPPDFSLSALVSRAGNVDAIANCLVEAGGKDIGSTPSSLDPNELAAFFQRFIEGNPTLIHCVGNGHPGTSRYSHALEENQKFLAILRGLRHLAKPCSLVLVTVDHEGRSKDGPPDPVWESLSALGRLGVNEIPDFDFKRIHLAGESPKAMADNILKELQNGQTGEVFWNEGSRSTCSMPRVALQPAAPSPEPVEVSEPVRLVRGPGNTIQSIQFVRTARKDPGPGQVEIRIHATALNYKDLLKIYGRLHPMVLRDTFFGDTLGMECTGEVLQVGNDVGGDLKPGDRVVALLPHAFSSYATIDSRYVVAIHGELGLEAAGIPLVYLTACHSLLRVANLQAGERILIHQATGGLGLAALDVARSRGATIFATAGSDLKREYLRNQGIEHVFPSRDLSFVEGVRNATNGQGVDVVLSAQTGSAQRESLSLLRSGGRFVEVGKKDIIDDAGLPLRAFNRNLTFASVDIDRLLVERPEAFRDLLEQIIDDCAAGKLHPGKSKIVTAARIQDGFSEMAQSRHVGKVLIDFRQGEVDAVDEERTPGKIDSKGAYLITGGTSGFGIETAKWLAQRGAGRIVLISRRGRGVPGLDQAIDIIKGEGSEVMVIQGDVTDSTILQSARKAMLSDGFRSAGVIHGAMVLDDAMLSEMDADRFQKVFEPKVKGALELVSVFEQDDLDFMVFYSSVSALIGNRGQANYVAANAYLDGLALALRHGGVPALSINWGALAETGVVARSENLGKILEASGVRGLDNKTALEALESALSASEPRIAAMDVDWVQWKAGNERLAMDPRFREHVDRPDGKQDNEALRLLREEIQDLKPEEQAKRLEDRISSVLSTVLKVQADQIRKESRLNEMGVDSLMLMELGLGLKEATGITFTAMEFLKGPTVRELALSLHKRILE